MATWDGGIGLASAGHVFSRPAFSAVSHSSAVLETAMLATTGTPASIIKERSLMDLDLIKQAWAVGLLSRGSHTVWCHALHLEFGSGAS